VALEAPTRCKGGEPAPAVDRRARISAVLAALVIFDVVLASWAFLAPDLWFRVFHGVPYHDPEGFLRRCGANWAAFALFQAVAFLRWRQAPYWVAVAAGIRLSDIFTDWTYLAFATHITAFGIVALALASPLNMLAGWWLLRAYRRHGAGEGVP
jgi:hypothetical protein